MNKTKLILRGYNITELSLRLNPNFKPTPELIDINPVFSRTIGRIDNDNAYVIISVEIANEGNKPFVGKIVLQGTFGCKDWENDEDGKYLMKETTSNILFPYLRHALSEATTLLNVPSYVLPVVNTSKLFSNVSNRPKSQD